MELMITSVLRTELQSKAVMGGDRKWCNLKWQDGCLGTAVDGWPVPLVDVLPLLPAQIPSYSDLQQLLHRDITIESLKSIREL